jgi:hypothetical protein
MIYFDNGKNAFAYEIENPIATISEEVWTEFCSTDKWDIINGTFTDISTTPEYIAEQELKQAEIQAKKNITKRQMLIWLFLNKQKTETDILNAIDTISDNSQKYLALVNYNGTNEFYYGNEFVSIIGQALGLTTAQIKTMFDDAKSL